MAGQGQIFTFSDTVTTRKTISNVIRMIDPQDTPMTSMLGMNNQSKFKLLDFPNHRVEWLEDTLRVRTLTGAEALDNSETLLDMTAGHELYVKPGDVLLVEETGEKIWVQSVDDANNQITVVRGYGDTSATAGTDTSPTLTYLYSARLEGDESDDAPWTTPTTNYNYSQIMHWEIKVSGSEQDASTRYGITDTFQYNLMKALGGLGGGGGRRGKAGDLMIDIERSWFYGERVQRTSSVAGGMGGLDTFITTNVQDLNGVDLTQDVLEDAIEDAWGYGGKPTLIVCNAFNKRLISSWYADSVRTERSERTGGVVISNVETEFGNLDIMLNRWCPANKVYVLQPEFIGGVTLRDWRVEPLAKTGDYVRSQIVGEFSIVVVNEKAHAIITDTSTS